MVIKTMAVEMERSGKNRLPVASCSPRPVLIFGDDWRFCRWAARVVATIDFQQELALLPYSDPLTPQLLESIPEEARPQSWWLILCDGSLVAGNRGGSIALMSALQATRAIGRLISILHLSPFLDVLDRHLAVWRRWLSRFVPEGSAPRRYP